MDKYEKIASHICAGRTDVIAGLHSLPDKEIELVEKAMQAIRGVKLDLKAPTSELHRVIAKARTR